MKGNLIRNIYFTRLLPVITLLAVLLLIMGCTRSYKKNSVLTGINRELSQTDISQEKASALHDSLINMDVTPLSDSERHYRDFLLIKSADKAYITHTSDSLIKEVMQETPETSSNHYAEIIYYAGRVYSDLKDYPRAIQYFHKALKMLPKNTGDLDLKARITSQTARLLNTLCMYDEAIPLLKETIELDITLQDTTAYMDDILLLGGIELRNHNFREAEKLCRKVSEDSPDAICRKRAEMYLAFALYRQDRIEDALALIRNKWNEVPSQAVTTALAFGAQIYRKANRPDSAFLLARQLVDKEKKGPNLRIGYHVLLSPEVSVLVKSDSIKKYALDYAEIITLDNDENQRQLVMMEQAWFNHDLLLRDNEKQTAQNSRLKYWLLGSILITCIMALYVIFDTMKRKRLKRKLTLTNDEEKKDDIKMHVGKEADIYDDIQDIRKRMQEKVRQDALLMKDAEIKEEISGSSIYTNLIDKIRNEISLRDNDPEWNEIEAQVLSRFPEFKNRFELLTMKKHTTEDYRMALMIRMGLTVQQMSVLLSKAKGTIGSRRKKIGRMMLDKNIDLKEVDTIIRAI